MRNCNYVSAIEPLPLIQADTPPGDKPYCPKKQDMVLVFHVRKMFRMRSSRRNDIEHQKGNKDRGSTNISTGAVTYSKWAGRLLGLQ